MNATTFPRRRQGARSPRSPRPPAAPRVPRLLRRERSLIAHHAKQWLDGRPWHFIYSPFEWVLDLRYGRATMNLARGCGMDDEELRQHPERLIEAWEARI